MKTGKKNHVPYSYNNFNNISLIKFLKKQVLTMLYKIELIADKDQNNTYKFTNCRINLYQVIYAIMIYLKKIFVREEIILFI